MASEITKRPPGARPTGFPGDLTALLADYATELAGTTLSAETCRTYMSRVGRAGQFGEGSRLAGGWAC